MGAVVSRILREGVVRLAAPETVVRLGDVLLIVGPPKDLRDITRILGRPAEADLKTMPSAVRWQRMVVTNGAALGVALGALEPLRRHDAVISRVTRSGVELSPSPALRLQFGDICTVIGEDSAIAAMAEALGNKPRLLQDAQVLPIFIGVALGVLVGSIPLALPGMPAPLRLGLAGGPLVVAIALARIGHIGPLAWFLPPSANQALRDLGIAMFLGVVGLGAGQGFVAQLVAGDGLRWVAFGALITFAPLLVVGVIAHAFLKLDHLTVCGLLAGGMTDPPALAFANGLAESEAPSLAYATVYPLVMVLRILTPQLLILAFWAGGG
jgi:putative transport protein